MFDHLVLSCGSEKSSKGLLSVLGTDVVKYLMGSNHQSRASTLLISSHKISDVVEINVSQTTGGPTLLCVILGFKGHYRKYLSVSVCLKKKKNKIMDDKIFYDKVRI